MDKEHERKQLARVFGPVANQADDCERPDFLFPPLDGGQLGVEVTSLYASNADAKLKLIPGYANALISRAVRPHRSDLHELRVEDATLTNPDGSVVDTVTGIFQEMPSQMQRYEMLASAIAEKEQKLPEYLRRCTEVDLIIFDGSNLFHHSTHEEFYRHFHQFSPKASLVRSPFREIHLITTLSDQKRIYIPLIANTFYADCFALERLLAPTVESGRPSREVFQILAAGLLRLGYARARVTSGSDGVGFSCGAWELFYAEDGKKLRNWVSPSNRYPGEALDEALSDASTEVMEEAVRLASQRSNWFAAMDVRLPVHEA